MKLWPEAVVLSKFRTTFLLLILFGAASIQAASSFQNLSPRNQLLWLKLLHYSPLSADGDSMADGAQFFFSPEGESDPDKELQATLEGFQKKIKRGRYQIEAACAFPARFDFLKKVGLHNLPKPSCPIFEKWQREVKPESLTLVFSTAYPNNPASMFGHTFLRFNKKGKSNDLLDYGTAYSAIVDPSDWGVVYALKGVFGGYPGFFDLSLYYTKVNEYNDTESRDLIEYKLNIPPERVRNIFKHLWELYNTTHFNYFFTLENCSYHLAGLINVGIDEVIPEPRRWYYLPSDLVQHIDRVPGLLGEAHSRPSLKKKIKASLGILSSSELSRVKEVWTEQKNREGLNATELDSLILLMHNQKFVKEGKLDKSEQNFYTTLLQNRAKLGHNERKPAPIVLSNKPHQAHSAQKVSFGHDKDDRLLFSFSSGYHDLLARDEGLEPFSRFEFLSVDAFYDHDKKKVDYDRTQLINIASLHPYSFFNNQLSWKVGAQWKEIKNLPGNHQTYGEGKLGLSLGNDRYLFSFLLGASAEFSSAYESPLNRKFRGGPNAEVLAMARVFKHHKILLSSQIKSDAFGKWDEDYVLLNSAMGNSWFSKNVDFRYGYRVSMAKGKIANTMEEITFRLGYYF